MSNVTLIKRFDKTTFVEIILRNLQNNGIECHIIDANSIDMTELLDQHIIDESNKRGELTSMIDNSGRT